jgi:hypothetical protein
MPASVVVFSVAVGWIKITRRPLVLKRPSSELVLLVWILVRFTMHFVKFLE